MCQELLLYRLNSTTVEVTLSRPVGLRLDLAIFYCGLLFALN